MKKISFQSSPTPIKPPNYLLELIIWMLVILLLLPVFAIAALNAEKNELLSHILLIFIFVISCLMLVRITILAVVILKHKFFETAWIRNMRGLTMPEFARKTSEVLRKVYSSENAAEQNDVAECELPFLLEDAANCTACELGKYQIDDLKPILAKRCVHMKQAVRLSGESTKSYLLSVDFVRESDECDWKIKDAKAIPFKNTRQMKKWF